VLFRLRLVRETEHLPVRVKANRGVVAVQGKVRTEALRQRVENIARSTLRAEGAPQLTLHLGRNFGVSAIFHHRRYMIPGPGMADIVWLFLAAEFIAAFGSPASPTRRLPT